jgi:uncharacterized SAM-dependent methyltransferase
LTSGRGLVFASGHDMVLPHLNLTLHSSLFPERMTAWFRGAFQDRRVNPMLHYQTFKQARQWLRLHEAHSPARRDPECAPLYRKAFVDLAGRCARHPCHVIGLGAGGGQKEASLIELLEAGGRPTRFTPVDASLPLVASAWQRVASRRPSARVTDACDGPVGLICDLASAADLGSVLHGMIPGEPCRVFTCFGLLPNLEPEAPLPKLADAMRRGDWLLISANLAPGSDYQAGMEFVLPQYRNPLTDAWLMEFLWGAGVGREDGALRWRIERRSEGGSLGRFTAGFEFKSPWSIDVEGETFAFQPGEALRLFDSYRYTPDLLQAMLNRHGLEMVAPWMTSSGEEGVWLCRSAR